MDESIIQEFVLEAVSGMQEVEQDLLSYERTADPEILNRVFRTVHSIKGTGGYLKLSNLVAVSHEAETLLDQLRKGKRNVTPQITDVILATTDILAGMLQAEDLGENDDPAAIIDRLRQTIQSQDGVSPPSSEVATQPPGDKTATTSDAATANETGEAHDATDAARAKSVAETSPQTQPKSSVEPNKPTTAPLPTSPSSTQSAPEQVDRAKPQTAKMSGSIAPASSERTARATPEPDTAAGERTELQRRQDQLMRVRVKFLDDLLQLTGNMVMARNQMLNAYNFRDDDAFSTLSQCITEVHKSVVQTRMQNVGEIFDRFQRVSRDLARDLHKEVRLKIIGGDIQLDRTVLESLVDPLTHMVRNCIDHAIESPEERARKNKPRHGTVQLGADQASGELTITVSDDGRGLDSAFLKTRAIERGLLTDVAASTMSDQEAHSLIFESGYSTKDEATSVSGRGVGMDVVRTNVEKIGGVIDIESILDQGTRFTIRIPLTRALVSSSVISALIVRSADQRFAIPETAVSEIIKVNTANRRDQIRELAGRHIFQLRDLVLPVLRLDEVLGRTSQPSAAESDRLNGVLVVVRHRDHLFGILVDRVLGIDEVVVRSTPKLIQGCAVFMGHTVMGDGHVVMILDINGIVDKAQLTFADSQKRRVRLVSASDGGGVAEGKQRMVVFNYSESEYFAIPLDLVSLIERIRLHEVKRVGDREFYRSQQHTLPILRLDQLLGVRPMSESETDCYLISPSRVHYSIAILAGRDVSMVEIGDDYEPRLKDENGVLGTFVMDEKLVMLLDPYRLFERHSPDRFDTPTATSRTCHILVAEDTPFFQHLIVDYVHQPGRQITVVGDGAKAFDELQRKPGHFDLLISDIEMPEMDGFELIRRIRAHSDDSIRNLKAIAVTSLATDDDIQQGLDLGFTAYMAKIDKQKLLNTVAECLDEQTTDATSAGTGF